jgi:hypothetical protein
MRSDSEADSCPIKINRSDESRCKYERDKPRFKYFIDDTVPPKSAGSIVPNDNNLFRWQSPMGTSDAVEHSLASGVDMRASEVRIAEDYTKRKHVLKVSSLNPCRSEFLLQAENTEEFADWYHALQEQMATSTEAEAKFVSTLPPSFFAKIVRRSRLDNCKLIRSCISRWHGHQKKKFD